MKFDDFTPSTCNGSLMLQNDIDGHPMIGTFYYFVMFRQVLEFDVIKNLHKSVKTTILLPKGGGNPLGVTTSDGRPCISSPTDLPYPGSPGAPAYPGGAGGDADGSGSGSGSGGDGKYSTSGEGDINEDEKEEKDWADKDKEGFDDANKNPASLGADFLDCKASANEIYPDLSMPITAPGDFTMSGKRINCPAGCLEKTDNKILVIGPELAKDEKSKKIYSLESSICGAAIHSGMMNEAEGGSVVMHLTKPRGPFITLNQNKIESKEGIQTEIALYLHVAPNPVLLKCNQSLLDSDIKLESGKS